MKNSACIILLLVSLVLGSVSAGLAMETDQYNLPPEPLFDIGDEVSGYVEDNLKAVVDKINTDITLHQSCLDKTAAKEAKCGSPESEMRKLAELRANGTVSKELFKLIGDGNLFITSTGKWFKKHHFSHEPSSYKAAYTESIYLTNPIDYVTLSPTVRLYGTEFGTDKIEHLLQQGYKYYKIYNDAVADGKTSKEATQKAVKWGQRTERTYFGMLVSGVYSNADLYANYAGMKFYLGLTNAMQIGTTARQPILILKEGLWKLKEADDLRAELIKPFLTDHLNEALNPSGYSFLLYPFVKNMVKKNDCAKWQQQYPNLTAAEINTRSTDLTLWNGEDYGFAKKGSMVKLAEVCYADNK